jgi:hypothetical protein
MAARESCSPRVLAANIGHYNYAGDARTGCDDRMDMTAKPIPGHGKPAGAMILLGALVLATGAADAVTAPIYKCLGSNLGLIYTDQPCKGGEQLDIRAGDADPVAVARLERARDQLDRSAAARIADERRAAAQRDLATLARRQRDEDRNAADAADYSAALSPYDNALLWYPAFGPMRPPHPPRRRPLRNAAPRDFAPNPPYVVPRS